MGMELIADREVSLAEDLNRATEVLQAFPEAAALSADELAAAADKVVAECNPDTATPAAPGMVRLTDNQIKVHLFYLKMPVVDDELPSDGVFPPGWLEARRQQLAQRTADGVVGVSAVAKIRVNLPTRGYVEVPERPAAEDIEYGGDDDEWWLEQPADPSTRATIWLPVNLS